MDNVLLMARCEAAIAVIERAINLTDDAQLRNSLPKGPSHQRASNMGSTSAPAVSALAPDVHGTRPRCARRGASGLGYLKREAAPINMAL